MRVINQRGFIGMVIGRSTLIGLRWTGGLRLIQVGPCFCGFGRFDDGWTFSAFKR